MYLIFWFSIFVIISYFQIPLSSFLILLSSVPVKLNWEEGHFEPKPPRELNIWEQTSSSFLSKLVIFVSKLELLVAVPTPLPDEAVALTYLKSALWSSTKLLWAVYRLSRLALSIATSALNSSIVCAYAFCGLSAGEVIEIVSVEVACWSFENHDTGLHHAA